MVCELVWGLIIGFLLGVISMMDIMPDPYHRDGKVTVFEWIYRELDELINGEKG